MFLDCLFFPGKYVSDTSTELKLKDELIRCWWSKHWAGSPFSLLCPLAPTGPGRWPPTVSRVLLGKGSSPSLSVLRWWCALDIHLIEKRMVLFHTVIYIVAHKYLIIYHLSLLERKIFISLSNGVSRKFPQQWKCKHFPCDRRDQNQTVILLSPVIFCGPLRHETDALQASASSDLQIRMHKVGPSGLVCGKRSRSNSHGSTVKGERQTSKEPVINTPQGADGSTRQH